MCRKLTADERAEYKSIHDAYNIYVDMEIVSIDRGRPRNSHIKLLALRANTIMQKNEFKLRAYSPGLSKTGGMVDVMA